MSDSVPLLARDVDGLDLWASYEDWRLAERDRTLYGTVFVTRDERGLLKRVDPSTIEPSR